MKKPALPTPAAPSAAWLEKARELLDVAFGRRGNRFEALPENAAVYAAGANPTKAEFDAMVDDVNRLRARLAAYDDRFNVEG